MMYSVEDIDVVGAPFHDPAADAALALELKAGRPDIEVVEMATDIIDPALARPGRASRRAPPLVDRRA